MIHPNMHDELFDHLEQLADPKLQKKLWVDGDYSKGGYSFDDNVHFIFDDTQLWRDPLDCIGSFLRNANEAAHVTAVAKAIDALLKKYGGGLQDSEYITKPEWQAVLDTAKAALAVVSDPEPKTHPSVVELVKLMKTKQDGPKRAVIRARAAIQEAYRARETDPDYFDKPAWQKSLATAKAELAAAPDAEPR